MSAGLALERVVDRLLAGESPERARPKGTSYDWAAVVDLVTEYADQRGIDRELLFRALGIDHRPRP